MFASAVGRMDCKQKQKQKHAGKSFQWHLGELLVVRYDFFFCEFRSSSTKQFGAPMCEQTNFSFFVLFYICLQHFREHLDKLYARGIGMLDIALTEAFELLNNVSKNRHTHTHTHISSEIYYPLTLHCYQNPLNCSV